LSKQLLSVATAICSKVSGPRFVVLVVGGLFALSFDNITSWAGVGYLVCLGVAVVLVGALAVWLDRVASSRRASRARKRPRSQR
jgi:hypothetical protein